MREGSTSPAIAMAGLPLALILAAGAIVVWGLLSLWAVQVGLHVAGWDKAQTERLIFLPDGTVRVETSSPADHHSQRHYRDLDGNSVAGPDGDNRHFLQGTRLLARLDQKEDGAVSWERRLRTFGDGQDPATLWYFVADGRTDGTGYFVGYDSKSRARVGFLGTAGFRPGPLPAEELFPCNGIASGPNACVLPRDGEHPRSGNVDLGLPPGDRIGSRDVYVLGRDGKIYHADLPERTVRVAREERDLCWGAIATGRYHEVRGTPSRLLVRTADTMLLCDERGEELSRYPIPDPLRGQEITFAETSTGEALLSWHSPIDFLAPEVEHRIFWISPDGRCREARVTLPRPSGPEIVTFGGLVVPEPLVLGGMIVSLRPRDLLEEGLEESYPEAMARALWEFGPALIMAQLIALGCAVHCYRRLGRFGRTGPERLAWTLFVLALGLPGWIAFRFGMPWPVLEACPKCQQEVPQDRESCVRCEMLFPTPVPKGTEVFA